MGRIELQFPPLSRNVCCFRRKLHVRLIDHVVHSRTSRLAHNTMTTHIVHATNHPSPCIGSICPSSSAYARRNHCGTAQSIVPLGSCHRGRYRRVKVCAHGWHRAKPLQRWHHPRHGSGHSWLRCTRKHLIAQRCSCSCLRKLVAHPALLCQANFCRRSLSLSCISLAADTTGTHLHRLGPNPVC